MFYSSVEKDEKIHEITDFCSFYSLVSSIKQQKKLRAAYSYYNMPGAHTLAEMMQAMLVIVKVKHDGNAKNIIQNQRNSTEWVSDVSSLT